MVSCNQDMENLLGVAIRCGQDRPDEYGKTDGQDVKRGVAHNTPIHIQRFDSSVLQFTLRDFSLSENRLADAHPNPHYRSDFAKLNIHRLRPNFEIGSLVGRNSNG